LSGDIELQFGGLIVKEIFNWGHLPPFLGRCDDFVNFVNDGSKQEIVWVSASGAERSAYCRIEHVPWHEGSELSKVL
jgi:hypothetical protein